MKRKKTKLGRWVGWTAAAASVALLSATLETGRVHALSNSAFTYLGALSNVVTPNGDGRNDYAFFCFDNPRDSAVSGTIYDLRGARVSGMTLLDGSNCPGTPPGTPPTGTTQKLAWDGRADGRAVAGGIYVYQIQAEGTTITGTVMVAR